VSKRSEPVEGETTADALVADAAAASLPEAPTEATEPETSDEPADEPVAPFKAKIIDPVEVEAAPEPEETLPEIPKGHELLSYIGDSDAFVYGEYTFRVGQPVAVPSAVAEELLTYPFERFERT
jgi:hypothetical protein